MPRRLRRIPIGVGLALAGGYLLAGPGTGCGSFAAETVLSSIDFCFIFDCQNGLFGGTIDPCGPVDSFSGGAVLTPPTGPTFVDCPPEQ